MIIKKDSESGHTNFKYDFTDLVNTRGNLDYVKNGAITQNVEMPIVMVGSASELSSLTEYEAGTIAFTPGFADMWQKSAAGEWVTFE